MMNRVFFPTPVNSLRSLTAAFGMLLFLFALSASAQDRSNQVDAEEGETLTGTWVTEAPIPYLVEFTDAHPHGEEVPHEHLQLLERSATMEWVLKQRPDGLIVGTNDWIAHDEAGNTVFEGVEGLLGYIDGEEGMLAEPADEANGTAQINFEFRRQGTDRIQGHAYSIGSAKLLIMRFELVRK